MTAQDAEGITSLLRDWREGDDAALDQLAPLVYGELRRIARRCLRGERAGGTLQTTGLVHEAFLRLLGVRRIQWTDHAHFFAVMTRLMRRVLVDQARRRGYQKRGGDAVRVSLDDDAHAVPERSIDLVALDEAISRLADHAPRKARVVELRFFGGLANEEVAAVLGVSVDTVKREWRTARLWLLQMLSGD
ncbi:MAG TPA: sigma-70 family RNA polymerase sigma factor [Thermoanaerobaculia bacterium]|nr:sigma-70 family RNA polymerase sigma factor [Thermoanaerobaculia bacterium]